MADASDRWPRGVPEVGQRAERSREILPEYIDLFTQMSGDRNPIHYDEELAKKTRFGGIVVQGGVTTSILNALVAEDLPGPGTVFMSVDWRFTAPVRPGDTITGAVEVIEARPSKRITKLSTTITRQTGEVVLKGTALCYTLPLAAD